MAANGKDNSNPGKKTRGNEVLLSPSGSDIGSPTPSDLILIQEAVQTQANDYSESGIPVTEEKLSVSEYLGGPAVESDSDSKAIIESGSSGSDIDGAKKTKSKDGAERDGAEEQTKPGYNADDTLIDPSGQARYNADDTLIDPSGQARYNVDGNLIDPSGQARYDADGNLIDPSGQASDGNLIDPSEAHGRKKKKGADGEEDGEDDFDETWFEIPPDMSESEFNRRIEIAKEHGRGASFAFGVGGYEDTDNLTKAQKKKLKKEEKDREKELAKEQHRQRAQDAASRKSRTKQMTGVNKKGGGGFGMGGGQQGRKLHTLHNKKLTTGATKESAKEYMVRHNVKQLFDMFLASLINDQPNSPVDYLLDMAKEMNRQRKIERAAEKSTGPCPCDTLRHGGELIDEELGVEDRKLMSNDFSFQITDKSQKQES